MEMISHFSMSDLMHSSVVQSANRHQYLVCCYHTLMTQVSKKVKALTFSDDHKTDDHIDISKKLTYDFIKEALTHDKVPAQIQLR